MELGTQTLELHHQLQSFAATIVFVLAAALLLLSVLLKLATCSSRRRRWCSCSVCRSYVTSSWSSEFDNLVDWHAHLLRRRRTFAIHVLGSVVTADPANVEHMLKTRFAIYPKGKPFDYILGDLLGGGIFNSDGESWRFQRKMASLELGSSAVRSHASGVVSGEVRNRLIPFLDSIADGSSSSSETVDLQDVFRRLAFDTICKISFGVDPLCLELSGRPVSEFAAAFDAASRMSARRAESTCGFVWRMKRMLDLGSERELRRSVKLVDSLAGEVIRQRRMMGSTEKEHHDLLSRFMSSAVVVEADDKYLRDIVVSFLLAGRDTVAAGLTGFFLLLSKNPRAASKIRDEIDRVMTGGGDGVPEYESLKEMHYVHAALYESMRLYPPVQFDSRFCAEDDVLPDGTWVGKGTRVTYSAYAMGRSEDIWGADAAEFRPERWLKRDGGGFSPVSPFRYPVFHAAFRSCIGKDLAIMEMKTVVVAVMGRFEVDVVEECRRRPRFSPGLTATLAGGLTARVRRRR